MSDTPLSQDVTAHPTVNVIESATHDTIITPPVLSEVVLTPQQESFLNHFSWGFLFLGWIHFLSTNLVTKALCMFIPIYGMYLYIIGIFRARRMSWATGQWKDFEHFEKQQRLMDKIGIIWASLVSATILGIVIILSITAWMGFQSANILKQDISSDLDTINQVAEKDIEKSSVDSVGSILPSQDGESTEDRQNRYLNFAQSITRSTLSDNMAMKAKFYSLDGKKDFETDILPLVQKIFTNVERIVNGYSMSGIFSEDDDQKSGYGITLSVIHNNMPDIQDFFTITVIQKNGQFIITDFKDEIEDVIMPSSVVIQENQTSDSDTSLSNNNNTGTSSSGSNVRKSTQIDLHRAPEYVAP